MFSSFGFRICFGFRHSEFRIFCTVAFNSPLTHNSMVAIHCYRNAMTTLVADSSNDTPSLLTLALLEAALREVEPGAMLLPVWTLHDVMAFDHGVGKHGAQAPHCRFHLIERDRLAELAANHGIDLPGEIPAADSLVLLVGPEQEWLGQCPAPEALRHYWKLLFHARVVGEVRRKLAAPAGGVEAIEDRVE